MGMALAAAFVAGWVVAQAVAVDSSDFGRKSRHCQERWRACSPRWCQICNRTGWRRRRRTPRGTIWRRRIGRRSTAELKKTKAPLIQQRHRAGDRRLWFSRDWPRLRRPRVQLAVLFSVKRGHRQTGSFEDLAFGRAPAGSFLLGSVPLRIFDLAPVVAHASFGRAQQGAVKPAQNPLHCCVCATGPSLAVMIGIELSSGGKLP
jgi:hypothetical protein